MIIPIKPLQFSVSVLDCRTEKNLKLASFRDNRETHKPDNEFKQEIRRRSRNLSDKEFEDDCHEDARQEFQSKKNTRQESKRKGSFQNKEEEEKATSQITLNELQGGEGNKQLFESLKEGFSPFRTIQTIQTAKFQEIDKNSNSFYKSFFSNNEGSTLKIKKNLMREREKSRGDKSREKERKQQREINILTNQSINQTLSKDTSREKLSLVGSILNNNTNETSRTLLSLTKSGMLTSRSQNICPPGEKENNNNDLGDLIKIIKPESIQNSFKTYLGEIKKFEPLKIKKLDDNPRKKLMAFLKRKRRKVNFGSQLLQNKFSSTLNSSHLNYNNLKEIPSRSFADDEYSGVMLSTQRYQNSTQRLERSNLSNPNFDNRPGITQKGGGVLVSAIDSSEYNLFKAETMGSNNMLTPNIVKNSTINPERTNKLLKKAILSLSSSKISGTGEMNSHEEVDPLNVNIDNEEQGREDESLKSIDKQIEKGKEQATLIFQNNLPQKCSNF